MNIEQANSVPIILLLENLNIKPSRVSGHDYYYLSPIRNEKTSSFHVNTLKNVWYDHGIGEGGNCITFAQKWLKYTSEDSTVYDAMRWIERMSGQGKIVVPAKFLNTPAQIEKNVTLLKVQSIREQALEDYLASRGIPLGIAQRYLKEVHTYNKKLKKHFFALALKNDSGGYELRNKFVKQCVDQKDITRVAGSYPKNMRIHIFEGFMDYLSIVVRNEGKHLQDNVIILNSLSCLKEAMAVIQGHGYKMAYTWLDNDDAGKQAFDLLNEFFKTEMGLTHQPMNKLYRQHKDVNEWHINRLGLPAIQ